MINSSRLAMWRFSRSTSRQLGQLSVEEKKAIIQELELFRTKRSMKRFFKAKKSQQGKLLRAALQALYQDHGIWSPLDVREFTEEELQSLQLGVLYRCAVQNDLIKNDRDEEEFLMASVEKRAKIMYAALRANQREETAQEL